MGSQTDSMVELVTSATELVERHHGEVVADPQAVGQLTLLRESLRESATVCPDGVVSGDLDDVVSELDAVLRRLEGLPEAAPALTG